MNEGSAATEILSIIGTSAMEELCQRLGGERVYIPLVPPADEQEICAAFEKVLRRGTPCMGAYEQVAKTYGLSARTIMRIVGAK